VQQNFIVTGSPNLIALTLHREHIYWTGIDSGSGLGNGWIGRQSSTAAT